MPHGYRARFGDAYCWKAEAEILRIVMKMLVHRTVEFELRALEIPYWGEVCLDSDAPSTRDAAPFNNVLSIMHPIILTLNLLLFVNVFVSIESLFSAVHDG